MAPCEGCPLRPGDWCSRLSWPGIPVTSFQWGRMVTINVSPGGAASPAREDAPRCRRPAVLRADNRPQGPSRTHPIPTRSLRADSRLLDPSPAHPDIVPPRLTLGHLTLGTVTGAPHRCPVTPCLGVADPRGPSRTHLAVVLQRLVRATDPKFRRGHAPRHSIRADSRALDPSPAHPTVLLPLPTHGQPSPRVVENAPQTASTAPAGADRAPSGASSRPGHPDPPDSRHRRGHSTRPGACPSGRGHSTPSGTAIPSPHAQDAPGRTEMSPHAQDVPSHGA